MAAQKTTRGGYGLQKRIRGSWKGRDEVCSSGMLENGRAEFHSGLTQGADVVVRREGWG